MRGVFFGSRNLRYLVLGPFGIFLNRGSLAEVGSQAIKDKRIALRALALLT